MVGLVVVDCGVVLELDDVVSLLVVVEVSIKKLKNLVFSVRDLS